LFVPEIEMEGLGFTVTVTAALAMEAHAPGNCAVKVYVVVTPGLANGWATAGLLRPAEGLQE